MDYVDEAELKMLESIETLKKRLTQMQPQQH